MNRLGMPLACTRASTAARRRQRPPRGWTMGRNLGIHGAKDILLWTTNLLSIPMRAHWHFERMVLGTPVADPVVGRIQRQPKVEFMKKFILHAIFWFLGTMATANAHVIDVVIDAISSDGFNLSHEIGTGGTGTKPSYVLGLANNPNYFNLCCGDY